MADLDAPLARSLVRLRFGCLLHATRLDIRPARAALEPGDLVARARIGSLQLGHLFKQGHDQVFKLGV